MNEQPRGEPRPHLGDIRYFETLSVIVSFPRAVVLIVAGAMHLLLFGLTEHQAIHDCADNAWGIVLFRLERVVVAKKIDVRFYRRHWMLLCWQANNVGTTVFAPIEISTACGAPTAMISASTPRFWLQHHDQV